MQPAALDALPARVPLTGVTAVATGDAHTCALTVAGAVYCWGADNAGQIGDGFGSLDKLAPTPVNGLGSGVIAIAAGSEHSCAVTAAGAVLCWGSDDLLQLGNGPDTGNRSAPLAVSGLNSGVVAVTANSVFTCALTNAGGVRCWGHNHQGQLGDGSFTPRNAPVNVVGLGSGVAAVSAGGVHACAVTTAGGALCWGSDSHGQLGNGAIAGSQNTPVAVATLNVNVAQIAAGRQHTCARRTNGSVTCFGLGNHGQLGNGVAGSLDAATDVAGLTGSVTRVAAGGDHACAVTVSGGMRCWGEDDYGQVGDGADPGDKLAPVEVIGLGSPIASVSTGEHHTCAVTTGGELLCWGRNSDGQLGNGTRLDAGVPTMVTSPGTCYALTTTFTGSGSAPVASPGQSEGCPPAHYRAGAQLLLRAYPGAGQRVQSWSSPVAGVRGEPLAALEMPAADTTATVAYVPCRLLTRSHTGSGTTPAASPPNSTGCAGDRYAAGETIFLQVVPGANQRVQQWAGAAAAPALGSQVNTLTMPDADRAVSVTYEPCFALTVTVVGQGEAININPPASVGCVEASRYAAGESVSLSASPAPGWSFAGWSGACGGSGICQVTVQGATGVTATFVQGGTTWLPLVGTD